MSARSQKRTAAKKGARSRIAPYTWLGAGAITLGMSAALVARGYRVSSVKHAHPAFDIDQPGRDSFRHREAGASEVLIVSGRVHYYESGDAGAMRPVIEAMPP